MREPQNKKVNNYKCLGYAIGWASSGRTIYVASGFLLGYYFLVIPGKEQWYNVLVSNFLLFFAFMSIGGQTQNIPNMAKAKDAANEVFSIIDEPSALDINKRDEDTKDDITAGMI